MATYDVKKLNITKGSDTYRILGESDDMTGATSSAAGAHGLVPAPSVGDEDKYLKGDGTWSDVDALPSVTSSDNGKVLKVASGDWSVENEQDISGLAPKASPVFTGSISLGRKANTTVGSNSFAVGYNVTASEQQTHAEGNSTTASSQYAHAEGAGATASGYTSHAEGYYTTASGSTSHAEGYRTCAIGIYAHTEGNKVYAYGRSQHVAGEYNYAKKVPYITITDEGASEYIPGKSYRANECYFKIVVNGTTQYYIPHAFVPGYIEPAYDANYAGSKYWQQTNSTDNAPEWDKNTTYAANTIVKMANIEAGDTTYRYFISKVQVGPSSYYDPTTAPALFHIQPLNSTFPAEHETPLEIIGNGGYDYTLRSNARALDWNGNEYLMGDVYVGCNADSTGGTKLEPFPVVSGFDNGKSLEVVKGEWVVGTEKIGKQYEAEELSGNVFAKTWIGNRPGYGKYIWTDGKNIYFSSGSDQYVLDKSSSTWSTKTWTGLTSFYGEYIWTDEENIYYSNGSSSQYILDKSTSTWNTKAWTGLTGFSCTGIWTDGENVYYSSGSSQYILDKSTSTWTAKSWTGLTSFNGEHIWTDGENIYYSYYTSHYVLDKSTSTWSSKTWTGLTNFYGNGSWTDGKNIYYSSGDRQYVLDKSSSTWSTKTWTGLTNFDATYIWTDGENIYYSNGSDQYVFENKYENKILLGSNGEFNPAPLSSITPSVMTGADGTNAGTSGLVPAPAATDNTKYLKGDGTWAEVDTSASGTITVTGTITNASGAYSGTFNDARISTGMKCTTLELGIPGVFNGEISVTSGDGTVTITCPDVAGTSTFTATFIASIMSSTEYTALFNMKANKVSNATEGNFAALDANGDLVDSGHKHSDYLTAHQDISGKANNSDIGIVINGSTASVNVVSGNYVLVQNSTITGITDGVYKAAANVSAGTLFVAANLTAVSGGLGAEVTSLSDQIGTLNSKLTIRQSEISDPPSGVAVDVIYYNDYFAFISYTSANKVWAENDSFGTIPSGLRPPAIIRTTGNMYASNIGVQIKIATDGSVTYDSKNSVDGRISFTVMYAIS